MAIRLDHLIVPSRNQIESAKHLATLLDVPWEATTDPFTPVHVNDTLTLDFAERAAFESHHYCFHVESDDFDAIFGRIQAAGLAFQSRPHGDADMKINRRLGGKNLYWKDADGHLWEILTVSYARPSAPAPAAATSARD